MSERKFHKVKTTGDYICDTCKMRVQFLEDVDPECDFCGKPMRPTTEADRKVMYNARCTQHDAQRN